ncbi:MAG: APC family permease, partial [Proteobacteria bacterium]|nr:APC family permease [Pseudomonadota bacterium]
VHFGVKLKSPRWFAHWASPILGIIVVLAVFSGMSGLATKLGLSWLAVGVVYGLVLHFKHRDELSIAL